MKCRSWTSRSVYHSYCGILFGKTGGLPRRLRDRLATEKGGTPILTLVMKMEQTLRAPFAGVLKKIKCEVGEMVQEGVELAEVEPA
jgi:hypothetical protein